MSDFPLLVTLFTDAGFCPRTKLASYAVWAKACGETVRFGGGLQGPIASANAAEVRALVNGVWLAVSHFAPPRGSRIIAQTDSLTAIGVLSASVKRKRTRARYAAELAAMNAIVGRTGLVIEYRHVRGHHGTATPRNAVNTWCDRECRRHLRALRQAAVVATADCREPEAAHA